MSASLFGARARLLMPREARMTPMGFSGSEIGRYTAQVLTHTTALSHSVGPKALLAFKRGMLPHSVTHAREGPLRTP